MNLETRVLSTEPWIIWKKNQSEKLPKQTKQSPRKYVLHPDKIRSLWNYLSQML